MGERLLSPEEAAARLRVSAKSVRKWLRANKLRGQKPVDCGEWRRETWKSS